MVLFVKNQKSWTNLMYRNHLENAATSGPMPQVGCLSTQMSQHRQVWQEDPKSNQKQGGRRTMSQRMRLTVWKLEEGPRHNVHCKKASEVFNKHKRSGTQLLSHPSGGTSGTTILHTDSEEKQHHLHSCPLTLSSSRFILEVLTPQPDFA